MCSQIQITDSDVATGSAAYIGIRRLRIDQELATAMRGRVQLVCFERLEGWGIMRILSEDSLPLN
jgi:hypothetical protein